MNEQQITQLIQNQIKMAFSNSQFDVTKIQYHQHTGTDAPQIDPVNLLGFPVMTSAPTDSPLNGTMRLYNSGGTRRLYAFISGVWYSTTLT